VVVIVRKLIKHKPLLLLLLFTYHFCIAMCSDQKIVETSDSLEIFPIAYVTDSSIFKQ